MTAPALLHLVPCQSGTGRHRADDINRTTAGDGRRSAAFNSPFKKDNCLYIKRANFNSLQTSFQIMGKPRAYVPTDVMEQALGISNGLRYLSTDLLHSKVQL